MITQQISVFLENKNGQLAEITGLLAKHHIDLRAINIAETADYGVLRMIVEKPDEAAALLRENGFIASSAPVVLVAVPDRPGGLNEILCIIQEAGIGVEYMYSIFGNRNNMAMMIFRVNDPEELERSISHAGIKP